MRVLIVDDDSIVLKSLEAILKSMDLDVCGKAKNGMEAFIEFKRLHPDLVLMDIRMDEYDGIFGTREILKFDKNAKVLLLTTFSEEDYIKDAIKIGAKGYILKDNFNDLKSSIEAVYDNKMVFDENIYKKAINIKNISTPNNLTEREIDILKLIADGLNNSEIAKKLFLSEGTVRNHISDILSKTGTRDRTMLAVKYLKGEL